MAVARNPKQVEDLDDGLSMKSTRPQHEVDLVFQKENPVLLPQALTGAFEHEPLASFLKSLTFEEHFMFSHCKLIPLLLSLLIFSALNGIER